MTSAPLKTVVTVVTLGAENTQMIQNQYRTHKYFSNMHRVTPDVFSHNLKKTTC